MIYTFTANLAIDLFIETEKLLPNKVNRTNYFKCSANGKGVNVSIILENLGISSTVTGFKGGFTGQHIEDDLKKRNIKIFMPEIQGLTRINVFTNVLNEKKEYTQVNPGPIIEEEAKEFLKAYFEKKFQKNDILTINGSFPKGIDENYIFEICKIAKDRNVEIVIDNSSKFVINLCKFEPFILKPNEFELCSWFDENVKDEKQFIRLSKKLIKMGSKNILLSLGENGAMLINENLILKCSAPEGKIVNTAMAGDTLLATYIAEIYLGKDEEYALKKAVCAGSSTAFRDGLTDFSDVKNLMKQVKVEKIWEEI
ncbi:1-phosphofructokinase [Helcococcus bovis]|uniref:1-phosphofructokinase n=1 Tax=Helcococcus bovis TaxID=3153252 RepID=UPI0038B87CDE